MLYRDRWGQNFVRVPLWRGTQGGRNKRSIQVLMIEDDPAIADMFQMQLEHDEYRVTVAGNAASIPGWLEKPREGRRN